jgi:hypothetical protein
MAALLLLNTSAPSASQAAAYRAYLNLYMSRWQATATKCPSNSAPVCYTAKGLAQMANAGNMNLHWVTGAAFLALGYADHIDSLGSTVAAAAGYAADAPKSHRCWARSQLRYILGSTGYSYVLGFGGAFPRKPHHKSSSCSADYSQACDWNAFNAMAANPNVAWGALVPGPDASDKYSDLRNNQAQGEPRTHYQGVLIGALAGLARLAQQQQAASVSLADYCSGYFDSLVWVAPSPPPPAPPAPPLVENRYAEALGLALQFYEAQQSGVLAPWNRFLRSAGGFRSDSHLQDGSMAGLDLTGGYYDAGDAVKFTLPLGVAMSVLAWGGVQFRSAYVATGQMPILMRTVKWGVDWMVKAHFAASDVPSQNQLVVQVRLVEAVAAALVRRQGLCGCILSAAGWQRLVPPQA